MQLTGEQVIWIGGISTILIELLKFVLGLKKIKIPRTLLTILLMIVSLILGYLWSAPSIAVILAAGDPLAALNALIDIAVAVVGYATLIYNILLGNVIDGVKNLLTQ